jgi:pteridine reductase
MAEAPLSGKVALVTGGALRVGRAIALALAEAGAEVAVHYRDSAEAAGEVAGLVRAAGRRSVALPADLAKPEACRTLVRETVRQLGGLDFLVHSAANFHRAALEDTDETLWASAMDLNARAGFLLAREAAGQLRQRRGRVVLISDALAVDPVRGYLAHSVSKAAVEGLVRALAIELAPEVSVNGVAPGTVLVPEGTSPEQAARWAKRVPLRRNGDPDDIASAVVFFCRGSGFVTGQILRVDGGRSLV